VAEVELIDESDTRNLGAHRGLANPCYPADILPLRDGIAGLAASTLRRGDSRTAWPHHRGL